jgi:hypothetical protein
MLMDMFHRHPGERQGACRMLSNALSPTLLEFGQPSIRAVRGGMLSAVLGQYCNISWRTDSPIIANA